MGHWYAIKTKPKAERQARDEIVQLGLDAYLPEYERERFNRRKRVTIITRLCHFPRYLFAQIDARDFAAVRACRGVADILPGFPLAPIPVPAHDVLELRAAQDARLFDDTDYARRLRGETVKHTLAALRKRLNGRTVRVKDGPFASFPGEVDAVHSLERLRVIIQIFGRPTPVELEMKQIEDMAA
jgi:transcriptional antiterminator NusG